MVFGAYALPVFWSYLWLKSLNLQNFWTWIWKKKVLCINLIIICGIKVNCSFKIPNICQKSLFFQIQNEFFQMEISILQCTLLSLAKMMTKNFNFAVHTALIRSNNGQKNRFLHCTLVLWAKMSSKNFNFTVHTALMV